MCDLLLPCHSIWSHLHLLTALYLRKDKYTGTLILNKCVIGLYLRKNKYTETPNLVSGEDRKTRSPVTQEGITRVGTGMEGDE